MGVHIPYSRGHTKTRETISSNPVDTQKRRSPYLKGHTEVWESIYPTQRAIPKRASPYPQPEKPHRSVGMHVSNSKSHTEAWDSIAIARGATPKRGSPYPQLEEATLKCGSPYPQFKKATPNRGSPYLQPEGPHRSVGAYIPNSRGYKKIVGFRSVAQIQHQISKKKTQNLTKTQNSCRKPLQNFPNPSKCYQKNPQFLPKNPPNLSKKKSQFLLKKNHDYHQNTKINPQTLPGGCLVQKMVGIGVFYGKK